VLGGRREAFEHVERRILVTRGEADEHPSILPAVESGSDRCERG
jgi:hypothetical protein